MSVIPSLCVIISMSSSKFLYSVEIAQKKFPRSTLNYGVGGVWAHLLEGQGVCARVSLDLRECIWNAMHSWLSSQSLTIPAIRVILHFGSSTPIVSTLVIAFGFIVGSREAELKSTTFCSLLLFLSFQSFLYSYGLSDITL